MLKNIKKLLINFFGWLKIFFSCPVAEKVANHIVNFPTHSQIPINILEKELDKNWNWLQKHIVNDFNI